MRRRRVVVAMSMSPSPGHADALGNDNAVATLRCSHCNGSRGHACRRRSSKLLRRAAQSRPVEIQRLHARGPQDAAHSLLLARMSATSSVGCRNRRSSASTPATRASLESDLDGASSRIAALDFNAGVARTGNRMDLSSSARPARRQGAELDEGRHLKVPEG